MTKIIDRIEDMLNHVFSEKISDIVWSGRRKAGGGGKDAAINVKSYEDNAIFFSLLADVAESNRVYNPFNQKNRSILEKFSTILFETDQEFKMKPGKSAKVFWQFIDYLYLKYSRTRMIKDLKKWIKTRYPRNFPKTDNSSNIVKKKMVSWVKYLLAFFFMEKVVGMHGSSAEEAKRLVKSFVELDTDETRLTFYDQYLVNIDLILDNPTSPLLIWSNFLKFLFQKGLDEEKDKNIEGLIHKIIKRATGSLQIAAHHISIPQQEAEATQWLAIPFIDMVKDMANKSYEKAEQAIRHFIELPNDEARLEAYLGMMAQPEINSDMFLRIIHSAIKGLEQKHRTAFSNMNTNPKKCLTGDFLKWSKKIQRKVRR